MIDTSGHDAEKHQYNLVYRTYVMNPLKDVYRFGHEQVKTVLKA